MCFPGISFHALRIKFEGITGLELFRYRKFGMSERSALTFPPCEAEPVPCDDPSRPDRKSSVIFPNMGCGLSTQKQDNVDDDDKPSRPHGKSSFMFPSVGQTFLPCVSGRVSIGRRSRCC